MKKILLLTIAILLFKISFSQEEIRVLFLGNSYTYVNDLPKMIKDIAINEGKVVPIIGEDLIIQLVHVLSYDKAATVAWILLEGLYGMQKTWSFMAPVYKQMLEYIHKE